RETGNVGDGFLEIAAQHQRRSIVMRLAEFVARRDVSDALAQVQILEPWRFADMEVIDRVQVVIETRQRHFARAQAAAVSEPPLDQQHIEAGARKIGAEDQPVMAGAYDDAVVGFFERLRQRLNFPDSGQRIVAHLECRGPDAMVNGRGRMAAAPEMAMIFNRRTGSKYSSRGGGGPFGASAATLDYQKE